MSEASASVCFILAMALSLRFVFKYLSGYSALQISSKWWFVHKFPVPNFEVNYILYLHVCNPFKTFPMVWSQTTIIMISQKLWIQLYLIWWLKSHVVKWDSSAGKSFHTETCNSFTQLTCAWWCRLYPRFISNGERGHSHLEGGSSMFQVTLCLVLCDGQVPCILFNQDQHWSWWPNTNKQYGCQ